MKRLSHQQGQTHLAQVVAALFAVTPLRQFGGRVKGIEEREKVGGIINQTPQVEVEFRNQLLAQLKLNGSDGFIADHIHVIPKTLTAQLPALDFGQQTHQRGGFEPRR